MNWFWNKPKKEPLNLQDLSLAAVGGLVPTGLLNTLGRRALAPKWETVEQDMVSPDFSNRLIRQSGLDLERGQLPPSLKAMGVGGAYMPPWQARLAKIFSRNIGIQGNHPHGAILLSGSEEVPASIIAHELGHGLAHSGKAGVLAQMLARGRFAGVVGPLGSMVDQIRALSGTKSMEERDRLLNQASLFTGAGMMPIVADEMQASRNAMKLLGQLPAGMRNPFLQNASKILGRNTAMYGLIGAGGILAPQAMKLGLRWSKEHER
jgi:hypothetical protein